jgi:CRP-like cAMP-binding protein
MRGDVPLPNRVALLEVEPALGAGLCPEQFRAARGCCIVSVVGLRRGKLARWRSRGSEDADGRGFLVIRGVLTRRVVVGNRSGSELLGRGDVVYPSCPLGERMVVSETSWCVEDTALLAVLDERFHRCAADWPQLSMALHQRSVLRLHSLLLRLAIAEHPQIARRVHLVLWHLADRWGSMEEQGVLLPLKLSRVALADLVCSTRESVSRALSELERLDLVRVRSTGYFLPFPSPGELQNGSADNAGPVSVTLATNGAGRT